MAKDEAGATGGARLGKPAARALSARLNQDAARIAAKFGLTYRAIVAERPSARGHYGICYEDGLIKIRLQHATRGTPLKYSSLVNTLCHELAHLRHFDHSEAFQRFYGLRDRSGRSTAHPVGDVGGCRPRAQPVVRCRAAAALRGGWTRPG